MLREARGPLKHEIYICIKDTWRINKHNEQFDRVLCWFEKQSSLLFFLPTQFHLFCESTDSIRGPQMVNDKPICYADRNHSCSRPHLRLKGSSVLKRKLKRTAKTIQWFAFAQSVQINASHPSPAHGGQGWQNLTWPANLTRNIYGLVTSHKNLIRI